jgi:hypothetical protein
MCGGTYPLFAAFAGGAPSIPRICPSSSSSSSSSARARFDPVSGARDFSFSSPAFNRPPYRRITSRSLSNAFRSIDRVFHSSSSVIARTVVASIVVFDDFALLVLSFERDRDDEYDDDEDEYERDRRPMVCCECFVSTITPFVFAMRLRARRRVRTRCATNETNLFYFLKIFDTNRDCLVGLVNEAKRGGNRHVNREYPAMGRG